MHDIDDSALHRIDVNLLVALDVLLAERSVSRAARRLALSQSALSHTLARLRELFDNELLVRSGRQMVPTPFASELAAPLRQALSQLGAVLRGPETFSPATANRTFRIRATDFPQVALLPRLSLLLAERAPGVRLIARSYPDDVERSLADGQTDLVIDLLREPARAFQRKLLDERFACLVRRGHPCLTEGLTVEAYAALPHAVVSPVGRAGGFVDAALAEHALARRVRFSTPQLFSAALAVSRSDMVLTVSEVLARMMAGLLPLVVIAPPLPLPSFAIAMIWHERRDQDPLHVWIRQQLETLAAAEI